MHKIDIDVAERNIFCNCVDKIWMGGNPEKSKKARHSNVYRTEELE